MPIRFIAEVIKGLFGISEPEDRESEAETNITVERERKDGPGTDSDGSTGRQEPPEQTGGEADAEAAVEDDTDGEDDAGSESVEAVTGIGPTYGGRLADGGIGTVRELARAEPATVAEIAEVSESRAADFVARAQGSDGS